MGSALVLAQGRPMTFSGCMALSCASFGMPSMHNSDGTLFMPTSSIIAVPKGMMVMVGGPPVPDMMALANKIVERCLIPP